MVQQIEKGGRQLLDHQDPRLRALGRAAIELANLGNELEQEQKNALTDVISSASLSESHLSELTDPDQIRVALLAAFQSYAGGYQGNSIPLKLAQHINREVGIKIGDSVSLEGLILPGIPQIPVGTIISYNKALGPLWRRLYNVGSVRDLSLRELGAIRLLGDKSANFIYYAFRRQSPH